MSTWSPTDIDWGQAEPPPPPSRRRPVKRRFHDAPKGTGEAYKLRPDHPALVEKRTIFTSTVNVPTAVDRILKGGENNPKIGKVITSGRWKGMPVYMLSLEERATCPATCHFWRGCYGNRMHLAHRWDLTGRLAQMFLAAELKVLADTEPDGFVVRLHVTGDFFSVDYVRLWAAALDDFPPLRVWGYTARDPAADPIGRAIRTLAGVYPDRFAIRWSRPRARDGRMEALPWMGDAIDVPASEGFLCPAQADEAGDTCCANCCACWESDRNVHFRAHGR